MDLPPGERRSLHTTTNWGSWGGIGGKGGWEGEEKACEGEEYEAMAVVVACDAAVDEAPAVRAVVATQ